MMELTYIKRILKGELSQYTYFINRYKDMAYAIAFRIINNKEDAEEVVQDSFLKAYQGLKHFRGDSKFSTWFYKIVVNTSLSKAKRKISFSVDLNPGEAGEVSADNIETAYRKLAQAEQKKIIHTALAALEMEDSLLLTLYYLNQNSIEEIFEITGIPPENIKMKLHRARKKMYGVLNNTLKTEMQYLL
jgi:RNA polymerase sigma-70 factor (ECF subfamily)